MNESLLRAMTAERDAVTRMIEDTRGQYDAVAELFLHCRGRVVFMGIGKSGHIGAKLAATFSSTGTPAIFVHAAEACHGDFGMIRPEDVAVLISNSGTTREVLQDLPPLRAIGCTTVAFTAGKDSPLARGCDYALLYPKAEEADHLHLAPTVSSTLALVLGDALACAVSEARGFTREDFHRYHPNGALGDMLQKESKSAKAP